MAGMHSEPISGATKTAKARSRSPTGMTTRETTAAASFSDNFYTDSKRRSNISRMAILDLVPMLTVPDVAATVAFYTETLGFQAANQMEGWAVVERDGVEVMFALPNEHVPFERPLLTGSLYLRTNSVDALWADLKEKANVLYPMEDFSYGMREFAILDNNGYCLQFGQPLEG